MSIDIEMDMDIAQAISKHTTHSPDEIFSLVNEFHSIDRVIAACWVADAEGVTPRYVLLRQDGDA